MEQKLWAVALILALLKSLECFHGEMEGDGNLKGNPLDFTPTTKLSMISHPPVGASGNAHSSSTLRTPLKLTTEKDHPQIYQITSTCLSVGWVSVSLLLAYARSPGQGLTLPGGSPILILSLHLLLEPPSLGSAYEGCEAGLEELGAQAGWEA